MKLTDIQLRFIPNARPGVTVKFDRTIADAEQEAIYEARHHKESGAWVFRANVGDIVFGKAQMKGVGEARIRMVDGAHDFQSVSTVRTNAPAINAMWSEPVMDVAIHEGAGLHNGFVPAILIAKFLFAAGEPVGLALVEWPSGIRVYEPMQIDYAAEPVPNRDCDKLVFLSSPYTMSGMPLEPELAPEPGN